MTAIVDTYYLQMGKLTFTWAAPELAMRRSDMLRLSKSFRDMADFVAPDCMVDGDLYLEDPDKMQAEDLAA